MAFTPGSFDIIAQIETAALDVVIDVILAQLKNDNKTTFTQQVGGSGTAVQGTIDVEITDLSIPRIRSANLGQRFKEGNTLASFQVDAELQVTLNVFGLSGTLTETFFVRINDLALSLPVSPGGLPLGISLGFANFDIDAGGLTTLRGLNPALNLLADFIGLGIRTALTPLKLIPIPILQFADAFAKFSLLFDKDSPYLGTNESGDGLYLATDFAAANQSPSDIAIVRDVIPPGSPFNIAVVMSNRPINQLIPQLLAQNHIRSLIPTASLKAFTHFCGCACGCTHQGEKGRLFRLAVRQEEKSYDPCICQSGSGCRCGKGSGDQCSARGLRVSCDPAGECQHHQCAGGGSNGRITAVCFYIPAGIESAA
jgi:hypothetical protein